MKRRSFLRGLLAAPVVAAAAPAVAERTGALAFEQSGAPPLLPRTFPGGITYVTGEEAGLRDTSRDWANQAHAEGMSRDINKAIFDAMDDHD